MFNKIFMKIPMSYFCRNRKNNTKTLFKEIFKTKIKNLRIVKSVRMEIMKEERKEENKS